MDVPQAKDGNTQNQQLGTSVTQSSYARILNQSTSRSHLPAGVRARTWEDRMEKEKREGAIKKLEQVLKEEKKAEITR